LFCFTHFSDFRPDKKLSSRSITIPRYLNPRDEFGIVAFAVGCDASMGQLSGEGGFDVGGEERRSSGWMLVR